jgi:hypothetical protein
MDARDFEVLQAISQGQRVFKPESADDAASPGWLQKVQRLIRLRDQGLIKMADPPKTFMKAAGGYMIAGPCELTADGYDEIERYGPNA